MMFIQLLVLTCACALGTADTVPNYGSTFLHINKAYNILRTNILSMDGNIPLLNDPRRHYAEIIKVVTDEAEQELSCLGHDYYADYQKNVNGSGPCAILHPQQVVDETKNLIDEIVESTKEVLLLVNGSLSDREIDDELNKNTDKLGKDVFLATGIVATQLNKDDEMHFSPHSRNLNTHEFLINGAKDLKKTVLAFNHLFKTLGRTGEGC